MDVGALLNREDPANVRMLSGHVPKMFDTFIDFPKPLIMAVNGVGTGFGATVLGLADFVIMAESARIMAPFAALANVPEACSTFTFSRKMGHAQSFWFLLSGEWMDARQCKAAGLAQEVVADDELASETMRRAQRLAFFPTVSLVETKKLMMDPYREQMKQANRSELARFNELLEHPACQEGARAIMEKRAPDFSRF
jgi:enoyl-CoA hydratase/carnithine racemase